MANNTTTDADVPTNPMLTNMTTAFFLFVCSNDVNFFCFCYLHHCWHDHTHNAADDDDDDDNDDDGEYYCRSPSDAINLLMTM